MGTSVATSSSVAVQNFPELSPFRESSRCQALKNQGLRPAQREFPSTVFGKVPKWHLVTASLVLGQPARPTTRPRSSDSSRGNSGFRNLDDSEPRATRCRAYRRSDLRCRGRSLTTGPARPPPAGANSSRKIGERQKSVVPVFRDFPALPAMSQREDEHESRRNRVRVDRGRGGVAAPGLPTQDAETPGRARTDQSAAAARLSLPLLESRRRTPGTGRDPAGSRRRLGSLGDGRCLLPY